MTGNRFWELALA